MHLIVQPDAARAMTGKGGRTSLSVIGLGGAAGLSGPPGVGQSVAFGPRIGRVQHVLMDAGDPAAARNFRDYGRTAAHGGLRNDPAFEGRADDGYDGQAVIEIHLSLGMENSHAG